MERKIIGIDLGHCETTAAYPRQTQADRYKVRRLNLVDKDQVIPTQIILTDEQMRSLAGHPRPDHELLRRLGEIRIGSNLSAYVPQGEKFSYFKAAPKDFDSPCGSGACAKQCGITHGMLMACFAFALVDNLLKFNVGDLSAAERENLDLLIGCPSTGDWTSEKAQDAYAQLIQNAANVHSVRIVPESRAAMFSSVENEQERISALDGALVFDFGSSTADCTYMLLGRKLLEFSWTLGASKIERQMVLNAYQTAVKINGPFTASPASIVDNEDLLRAAKEMYYSGKYGSKGHPMFCSFEDIKDGSMVDTPVRINDPYMEKVAGEDSVQILCDSRTPMLGSWKTLCRAFFQESAGQIGRATYRVVENGEEKRVPCGLNVIVLTGGASRMAFISELCREVFPDVHIYRETNPSHTVSNGLAWVAVSDENLAACKEGARREINGVSACSIDSLQGSIAGALFSRVSKLAEERTWAWANRPEEKLSVRVLQDDLTACMSSAAIQREMEDICRREIEQWKANFSAAMETAVNNQVKRLYSQQVASSLMIPGDIWQELQSGALSLSQIDVSGSFKNLDMSNVLLRIGKIAVQSVIWGVAAFFAAETFGLSMIAGFVADLIAESVMKDTSLDKPRKKNTRVKVAQSIPEQLKTNKDEILKGFTDSLTQQTGAYSDIVDKALAAAFEIVTLKRFEV